jgi:imidazolonepropionase-like amidohydrolase
MFIKIIILSLLLIWNIATQAETILIKAKSYVDVANGKLISPANIFIKDGIITAINPKNTSTDVRTIDLGQQILLPGFMDMHTHLDLDFTGSFDYLLKESSAKGALRAMKNAEKTLMVGFTTVRNMGQVHTTNELINVAIAEAAIEDWIKSPDVIPAGHMITINGGHGDVTMTMAEGLIELGPKYGIVNSVDDVVEAVRYQIKHGAKVIKIHATAGVLSMEDSVGAQQMTNDEMKAAVEEAHRHDYKVGAHAHGTEGIIAALNAGVDSIEHGSLIDDKAIAMMKSKGTYLVPTTGLVDYIQPMFSKMDPKLKAKAEYILPLARKNLSKAIKEGVNIALGSDAPILPHGDNAAEMVAMVKQGMSHAEALRTATINSADLLGKSDRGQIKLGMRADLITVKDNPLNKIDTVMDVPFVMKAGKVMKNQK